MVRHCRVAVDPSTFGTVDHHHTDDHTKTTATNHRSHQPSVCMLVSVRLDLVLDWRNPVSNPANSHHSNHHPKCTRHDATPHSQNYNSHLHSKVQENHIYRECMPHRVQWRYNFVVKWKNSLLPMNTQVRVVEVQKTN